VVFVKSCEVPVVLESSFVFLGRTLEVAIEDVYVPPSHSRLVAAQIVDIVLQL
jgi:hypothetical protein